MNKRIISVMLAGTLLVTLLAGCRKDRKSARDLIEQDATTAAEVAEDFSYTEPVPAEDLTVETDQAGTNTGDDEPSYDAAPVEESEPTEEPVEEDNSIPDNSDSPLWGTKRPVSAVLTAGNAAGSTDYDIEIEYEADGSYSYKLQDRAHDYILYFASNGKIIGLEIYEYSEQFRDGHLRTYAPAFFGLPVQSEYTTFELPHLSGEVLMCDRFDNLTSGDGTIEYLSHDDYMYDSDGNIADDESFFRNQVVERDDNGRLVKMMLKPYSNREFDPETDPHYVVEFEYEDDTVIVREYEVNPTAYDSNTRTTGTKKRKSNCQITLNSHGLPVMFQNIDYDSGYISEERPLGYDEYGNLNYWTDHYGDPYSFTYTY